MANLNTRPELKGTQTEKNLQTAVIRGEKAAVMDMLNEMLAQVVAHADVDLIIRDPNTLDASGKLLGSTPAPGSVRALHCCGERLLVLFTGEESTLYTSDLEELISFQPEEDVSQVFLLPDGRAFFAGDSGVTQIDFTR